MPALEPDASLARFTHRVLVVVAILALVAFVWIAREAFLLAFAAIVVATIISSIAEPLQKRFGLGRRWALLGAGVILIGAIALIGALIGTEIYGQTRELGRRLPEAVATFESRIGTQLIDEQNGGLAETARSVAQRLAGWVPTVLSALAGFVFAVVGGAFLAADPKLYRDGVAQLFPRAQHERIRETLDTMGAALKLWLVAQAIAMVMVGVLVGLGAWWIGLPAPLALGLFAGLMEFVPTIGAWVGAAPALLLAMTQGGAALVWTAGLFLLVQQIESNLITPIIGSRMVQLPPALTVFSIVAFGLIFGGAGVVVAAPLTVVAFVAAKKLWVRETLGEPTEVPGEQKA